MYSVEKMVSKPKAALTPLTPRLCRLIGSLENWIHWRSGTDLPAYDLMCYPVDMCDEVKHYCKTACRHKYAFSQQTFWLDVVGEAVLLITLMRVLLYPCASWQLDSEPADTLKVKQLNWTQPLFNLSYESASCNTTKDKLTFSAAATVLTSSINTLWLSL